jgi:hypothetical protein
MRYKDFRIVEYTDLNQAKQQIIKTISGLDARNEQQAEILDRIWKVINRDDVSQKVNTAFATTLADEKISKQERVLIMRNLTEILGNLSTDYASMIKFLDKLEKGGVVNINALSRPLSSFEQVFDSDPVAIKAFTRLAGYGAGKNQKGPGEYALAMLSNKISLKDGGGDLNIEGIGEVELKAAVGSSGGRLGHGGLAQKDAKAALEKYHDNVPALLQHFEQGAKGMGLGQFVQYLNQGLPARSPENQSLRAQIALDLYTPVFGEFAKTIAKAFEQEDYQVIEDTMVKTNYDHYLDKDYFDVLLLCSFGSGKFAAVKSGDDLVNLRRSGHLNAFSIAAVPTNAGMREIFAQMSLSRAKI